MLRVTDKIKTVLAKFACKTCDVIPVVSVVSLAEDETEETSDCDVDKLYFLKFSHLNK